MDNIKKNIVVKIENLKKEYRLGAIGGGTLSGDLQSWWARLWKKEDPNTKIGINQDIYSKNEIFLALDGINLDVYKGEVLGIIGSNGAGKSTLLKILSKVTAPTEGYAYIKGKISSLLEVGTGFNRELTGRENIYMNGAILGMTRAEITERIDQIIEFSECDKFIDTPVKRYSSGMYVKLAFSVAAHLNSDILIMDEVLAVGDIHFQEKCIRKMRSIVNETHRTILFVSHNMNAISQLCDRCAVLADKKIAFIGDTLEAIKIYTQNLKKVDTFNDFQEKDRDQNVTGKILLKSIELLDNLHGSFKMGTKIKIEAKWINKVNLDNLHIRFYVNTERGGRVGMGISEKIYQTSEESTATINLDTSMLAPGRYYASICFYEPSKEGIQKIHDFINQAFVFEIFLDPSDHINTEWYKARGVVNFSTEIIIE